MAVRLLLVVGSMLFSLLLPEPGCRPARGLIAHEIAAELDRRKLLPQE